MASVTLEQVSMTPERASRILSEQPEGFNRPVKPTHAAALARVMAAGEWRLNGETIIMNGNRLLDGQHRLHAVVRAGVTVPMLVVRGIEEDVLPSIDQGKIRTAPDVLGIDGVKNAARLASAAGYIYALERGRVADSGHELSTQERVSFVRAHHDDLIEAASIASPAGEVIGWHALVIALAYVGRRHPLRASFFKQLEDGLNLQPDDPTYVVRQRLIKERAHGTQLKRGTVAAWLVQAWNAHVTGKSIRIVRYQDGQSFPEMLTA